MPWFEHVAEQDKTVKIPKMSHCQPLSISSPRAQPLAICSLRAQYQGEHQG